MPWGGNKRCPSSGEAFGWFGVKGLGFKVICVSPKS